MTMILEEYGNLVKNGKMTKYGEISKTFLTEMHAILYRRIQLPTPHGGPVDCCFSYLTMSSVCPKSARGRSYGPAKIGVCARESKNG